MRRPNVLSLFAYQTCSRGSRKSRGFSSAPEAGRAVSVAPRRGAEAGGKALGDGGFPDVRRRMDRMFRLYRPGRGFADIADLGGRGSGRSRGDGRRGGPGGSGCRE